MHAHIELGERWGPEWSVMCIEGRKMNKNEKIDDWGKTRKGKENLSHFFIFCTTVGKKKRKEGGKRGEIIIGTGAGTMIGKYVREKGGSNKVLGSEGQGGRGIEINLRVKKKDLLGGERKGI